MKNYFDQLWEHPKLSLVICFLIANSALFAFGHIKSLQILLFLIFIVFTAFSALLSSVLFIEIIEKKFIYKLIFQLFIYSLTFALYLILNPYKHVLDELFSISRFTLFMLVFSTMLLMINLRAAAGYSFESVKYLWKKLK